jgi:hypothetical protein
MPIALDLYDTQGSSHGKIRAQDMPIDSDTEPGFLIIWILEFEIWNYLEERPLAKLPESDYYL